MNISYLRTFIQGSCIYIAGNTIIGFLNYFIRRTMALNLSISDYGTFYSAFAIICLIMAFTDLGIVQSGTVLISENAANPDKKLLSCSFSCIFWLKFLFALAAFLLLLLFHTILVEKYLEGTGHLAFLCLSLFLLFQVSETAFTALWNGLKKFFITNAIGTVRSIFLCLSVYLLVKRFALTGAAAAYLMTSIVFLLVSFFLLYTHQKLELNLKIPSSIWKRLLSLTGFIAFSTLMLNVIFHMDTIMLTCLKGTESSGIYNIALPIAQLVFSPLVFATVFLPIAVSMVREQRYKELKKVTYISIFLTVLILPAVTGGMYLLAPFFIRILFNAAFIPQAAPVLPILAGGFLFYALGNMIAQIIIAFNSMKEIILATTVTFFSNLVLNFLFIRHWDIQGAAWATCLSYGIFSLLTIFFFFRNLKQHKDLHHDT